MISVEFRDQFNLVLLYLSKDCSHMQVIDDLKKFNLDFETTFLVGDFNFNANESTQLAKFLKSKNLSQMISSPTHEKGGTIDHFYCPMALTEFVNVELVYPFFTDHAAICVKFLE